MLILLHEMGHFIDIKRRGLPARCRSFCPAWAPTSRWQAMGVPLETRAAISLAGPLAGFLRQWHAPLFWWQTAVRSGQRWRESVLC